MTSKNVILKKDHKIYVDSNFINSCKSVIKNSELIHLGMGEFYLKCPQGEVHFMRMRGITWDGMVGRGHELYDNLDGHLVSILLANMPIKIVVPQPILKISGLEWGFNVYDGDNLPYDVSDALRRINSEDALNDVKKALIDNFGDFQVVIDRTQPWYGVFKIPQLKAQQDQFRTNKAETLRKWGTTE